MKIFYFRFPSFMTNLTKDSKKTVEKKLVR